MQSIHVGTASLGYAVTGVGEPVLLIHGANLADGLLPLARHPALAGHFEIIRYHRRGMVGSTGAGGPISVGRQAEDALGLLSALGVERAHIVGYSYGGTVALELAATAPESLLSLCLLEPILTAVPSAGAFLQAMAPVLQRYAAGDVDGAVVDTFRGLGGEQWRSLVERATPGGVDQAIADASIFFESEGPSLAAWSFDERRAAAISAPVLSVVGSDSGPFFVEGRELLHRWFPQCTDADIDGATHFLHLQKPDVVAGAVATFLAGATLDHLQRRSTR